VRSFRRSSRYGVIGVVVVMIACAAIGLALGQESPKLALGLIFGLIALYLVGLFTLQSRDLGAVEADGELAPAGEGRVVADPTTLSEDELWAAMAVRPISPQAARARRAGFAATRGSIRLGAVICVLIFAGVVPIYLLETFIPFLICAPLIVAIAAWRGVRLLMPGGELDRGYEQAGAALEPLGLELTERPEVGVELRPTAPGTLRTRISGPVAMEGSRHGRRVRIAVDAALSEVLVAGPAPPFEARSHDGRLRLSEGPAAVREALAELPASPRWGDIRVGGSAEGIVVSRKRPRGEAFLCDLWLAERLAGALAEAGAPSR
jgi:hypothetical protein